MRVLSIAVDAANQTRPVRVFFRPHQTKTYAMDEQQGLGTSISIGAAVLAAAVGTFKWLLGREVERQDAQIKRIDEHDQRLQSLEKTAIDKEDLDRTETRIISAIGDIKQSVNSAHERIDRLSERR